ncbi:dihydroxyacetone kinase [Dacryopinax primogenitus]|uniref:Dihydroxyacetone kinase n=1 Tax=Dacryopinax primogenitus (strain DJM 731) TaxID=1858805 RepID=M5GCF8_DACPD|nr:dihydroxyacetone kinase [Dacryopinax primogenitus]EJU01743.1 dihydroxyacetone kinase [Dacryopinax primogenitus]
MTTKHIFNNQQGLVVKGLHGLISSNPILRLDAHNKVVYNSQAHPDRVSVVSGGGAGHEPFAAAYVGDGMLTAAVSGEIFASPSTAQITSALSLIPTGKGVLFIILNYTGDALHFGLAAEKARAKGIKAEMVVVGDDVAVGRKQGGLVGRRGLAGCVLVCKILGAAAVKGMDLENLAAFGRHIVANLGTIGLSLDHCHVPGRTGEWESLEAGSCELGMGIHNEPGVRHIHQQPDPKHLVDEMLTLLLGDDTDRNFVTWKEDDKNGENGEGPVLMINNLGGTSTLEMSAFAEEVVSQLASKWSVYPTRVLSGVYMTSLNGPGFSVTLLNTSGVQYQVHLLTLLDDVTTATGWAGAHGGWPKGKRNLAAEAKQTEALLLSGTEAEATDDRKGPKNANPKDIESAIRAACLKVIASEPDLTKWDTQVGDGDCGITFATAAQAVIDGLGTPALPTTFASQTIASIVHILEPTMGGTSGAIFSLYLTALSGALQTQPWNEAAHSALEALLKYTPAREGDRTLVDSLSPFCKALKEGKSLDAAVKAGAAGAEHTRGMRARLGRATYVGDGTTGTEGLPPDPGAWGVAELFKGIQEGLRL